MCFDVLMIMMVYGRLAQPQVFAGRPAPSIGCSELYVTSENIVNIVTFSSVSYVSPVLFFLQNPKYDFANTLLSLYAIFPPVVTWLNKHSFSRIQCRNQIRVNKFFVSCFTHAAFTFHQTKSGGPVNSYIRSLQLTVAERAGTCKACLIIGAYRPICGSGSSCRN